jgi:hypothetical protein
LQAQTTGAASDEGGLAFQVKQLGNGACHGLSPVSVVVGWSSLAHASV